MSEYEIEPVPGLPEPLPSGETLLWQGAPQWDCLARRAFHIRTAAIYFTALIAWSAVPLMSMREPVSQTAAHIFMVSILSALALSVLAALAWLVKKTTLYSITTKRVVIRCGIALPIVLNIPFKLIQSAALKTYDANNGEIVLSLAPSERLAYVMLWPHVRPWRFKHSEPMLRGIANAPAAAQILARALAAASGQAAQPLAIESWDGQTAARPPATAAA